MATATSSVNLPAVMMGPWWQFRRRPETITGIRDHGTKGGAASPMSASSGTSVLPAISPTGHGIVLILRQTQDIRVMKVLSVRNDNTFLAVELLVMDRSKK